MDGDHINDMDDDCCFNLDDLNNLDEVSDLDPLLDPNEIIKEIPIYLSQQLSNKLYVVQFPVRPRANPYVGKNTPREARYKPQTNKLELDIPLQTNSLWYNRDRGEELMLGLNEKEAQTIYDRTWKRGDQTDGLLDKQTLQSTIVPPQANYWMGVMKDDGLHLTPIHATLQLRPGLKYLDKIDEKNKNANKKAQVLEEEGNLNDSKGVKSMNTDDPGVGSSKSKNSGKGKTLGNATTESNSDKSILKKHARPKSQQRVGEEEIWMKLRYCDMESIETSNIFDQLITINTDPLICKTANMNEYLDRISSFPPEINNDNNDDDSNLEQTQELMTTHPQFNRSSIVSDQIATNNPVTATTFGAKSQPINNTKNPNNTRGKGTTRGARGSRGSRGKKNPRGKHT
ncbi:hypothetical protein Glove_194g23 [Diversispora epigaea]|uniref:DNA-directed RNA polymerase III subunit Rpc5 n=1 Tax=Diversispora epigaea TaxID=1348612 RepID=A0A397IUP6_9GLOM|nr:hypothetical protein Glove_194g23 [Diversispora epigaea]